MGLEFKGSIKTGYTESTPWWPEKTYAPVNAPNILYILMDDTGYADIGCYGSLIKTPNIDSLARDGIRYNDFHVNPMCSPTRASLLSGCNHHAVGMGYLANYDLGFDSYRGCVDPKYGFISEILSEKGYSTFMLGKWHLVNDGDITPAGPFTQWPLKRGFDKFYGFLGALTNQFYPSLVCGNEYIDQPKLPSEGYHFSEDITDKAIKYIGDLKSNDPKKPFFCYLAFGANHSPHQVPKEYIDRYRGAFDEGWDVYRRKVFERQKGLGLIPENAELAGSDNFIREWDTFTAEEQRVLARYMEVYAGFTTHTDEQIGRVINYLKQIEQYENTIIIFMTDNGASPEGTPTGTKNVFRAQDKLNNIDELGSENASCHYPTGWAHASNTPLKMYKTWAHNGGVKVPMIITWPRRIQSKGEIRTQYHHVVDINKTVLELCGIEEPEYIRGVRQEPKHGVSMVYTFDDPGAPRRRLVQYYEMIGNRGIWADGWKAVADHTANPTFDFSKDVWELYHTDTDFSECDNLADRYPEKLRELKELWWNEAGKYGVLPMLESHLKKVEGFHTMNIMKFRPAKQKTLYTLYPELTGAGVRLMPRPHIIKAYVSYKTGDEGVLIAGGDNQGGFALYIQDGRLKFVNNNRTVNGVTSDIELPEGRLLLAFDYSTSDIKSACGCLYINGHLSGRLNFTGGPLARGSVRVGRFPLVAVTGELRSKKLFGYTNKIYKVEIDYEKPEGYLDRLHELEKELRME